MATTRAPTSSGCGNLRAETFVRLMAHCSCMVGNSSAALREGAFIGVPAVTVGSRQQGRETGHNVMRVAHDAAAIRHQIAHGPYEPDRLFGDGTAGEQIAEVLAAMSDMSVQKRLHYSATAIDAPIATAAG